VGPAQQIDFPRAITESPHPIEAAVSQFDLTLAMSDTGSILNGVFTYNTDLFNHETIADMADRFIMLLTDVYARPGKRRFDIPIEKEEA
jgi:hypothetical protein